MLTPTSRRALGHLLLLLMPGLFSLHAVAQYPSVAAYRFNFQTPKGKFLSASRGPGQFVIAMADKANLDELFVVTDLNGGLLQSGDPVRLYVHNGYITLDAGDDLLKSGKYPTVSSVFTIVKIGGAGPIHNNDAIMLRTSEGAYLSLQTDGKMKAVPAGGNDARLVAFTGIDDPGIQQAFAGFWNNTYFIAFDDSPQGQFGQRLKDQATLANLTAPGATPHAVSSARGGDAGNGNPANGSSGSAAQALPANLPVGHYQCLVDHVPNIAYAGYFSILPGNKYVFEGFDQNARTGQTGSYSYDHKTGKILWLSGAWKTNNYYGIYALDAVMGNRIYLIPQGSTYSACRCYLQKN